MVTMHPGNYVYLVYLKPYGIGCDDLAHHLGLTKLYVDELIAGFSPVTAEVALRLERVLGRSAESWMQMQMDCDLLEARSSVDLESVRPIRL